ncbi:MAG: Renalase, oxidases 1,2-dihydro- and 1,6-dihydro-beta-NAD(P)H isomers back to NAD(P), partial [uncultured Quadrisphaera sp.]
RRPGGRLGERRVPAAGGGERVVDTGAAYFTVEGEGFAALADGWAARSLARPWTDTLHVTGPDGIRGTRSGPQRWASPTGLRSLVDDLAEGLDVRCGVEVATVGVEDGRPAVDGRPADVVVLAMPDPQAARLLDVGAADGLAAARRVLSLPWDPVVSVWAVYEERWWPELDAAFVNDDEVVTIVADDGRRRGDGAPVLVAHAAPDASRPHLGDPEALVEPVLAHVGAALGHDGPPPAPALAGVQRWTFSAPVRSHEAPCFVGGVAGGLLGVCGDAWGGRSKVERAWTSGRDLGRALLERL